MSLPLPESARRVVADLMPIAIVVAFKESAGKEGAGEGAAFADALRQAGADVEILAPDTAGGFDLAVLLAAADPALHDGIASLIERLAAISDRLLFVPTGDPESPPSPDAWFELFAEHGYQPVVDYDASFLARGAFLVDRNATAAESELAAFADRLSLGGALAASTERVAVLEAELGTRATARRSRRNWPRASPTWPRCGLARRLGRRGRSRRRPIWRRRARMRGSGNARRGCWGSGWAWCAPCRARLGAAGGLGGVGGGWPGRRRLCARAGGSTRGGMLLRTRSLRLRGGIRLSISLGKGKVKQSFFEKKDQKTFALKNKSFLLLLFKEEDLPFYAR